MMSAYNTTLYSPSAFKRALLLEKQRMMNAGVGLNQINQILLEDDNSTLDPNIHYSQLYDEDPCKRQSLLKYSQSSPFYDAEEFEEEIKINECHLKPKAHSLIKENLEKSEKYQNLIVPEIEQILRTKNFTENSIEEESVQTGTSPFFQTERIGTIGKNECRISLEKIDVNEQLSKIQINNLYKKTVDESHEDNSDHNFVMNQFHQENVSERIEMTNRSSYRSLSQIESSSKNMEAYGKNTVSNFSAFFSIKEQIVKANENEADLKIKNLSQQEISKEIEKYEKKSEIHEENVEKPTCFHTLQINNENLEREKCFGFEELEQKLNKIDESLAFKITNENLKISLNSKKPMNFDDINENNDSANPNLMHFQSKLKKITEENEMKNENLFTQSDHYEKPIDLDTSERNFELLIQSSPPKTNPKPVILNDNIAFFLSLEKSIKENLDNINNNASKIEEKQQKNEIQENDQYPQILENKPIENENQINLLKIQKTKETSVNQPDPIKTLKQTEQMKDNDLIDNSSLQNILIQNIQTLSQNIQINNNSNQKIQLDNPLNIKNDMKAKQISPNFIDDNYHSQPVKKMNDNFNINTFINNYSSNPLKNFQIDQNFNCANNKSNHISKIANSFKDIENTITQTINKHKIEIEKDCDLSVFKNFLHKVREESNERLSKKYFSCEKMSNPEENHQEKNNLFNNTDIYLSKFQPISPNTSSFPKELPTNLSYKMNKMKLPMETVTPNKPENYMSSTPSEKYSKQISSINKKYQSPIQIDEYSTSKFCIGLNKGNPSSTKTTKNRYDNSGNRIEPYFKFRSKSCEKAVNKDEKFRETSFKKYVKTHNWQFNNDNKNNDGYFQKKDSRNFLNRVDCDLKKRKLKTFQNEIKKKEKFIEEIKDIEELNKCKGKLTKNASHNLVSKLMQDAKRRNFEKDQKLKEKTEKEINNAIKMANTKFVNPKSEILSINKVPVTDQETRNFKKKKTEPDSSQLSCQQSKCGKENINSIRKIPSTKKFIQDSRPQTTNRKLVTDEKVTSNTFNDPFQDFMTNYNKKFVEGNSNLFNPSEEGNTHTISDTQVQTNLSKMEEQYEIIEDSANKEKKNTNCSESIMSSCSNSNFNFPYQKSSL